MIKILDNVKLKIIRVKKNDPKKLMFRGGVGNFSSGGGRESRGGSTSRGGSDPLYKPCVFFLDRSYRCKYKKNACFDKTLEN